MIMLKRIIGVLGRMRTAGGWDDGDAARLAFGMMSDPTPEMIKAGTDWIAKGHNDGASVWRAMINAELGLDSDDDPSPLLVSDKRDYVSRIGIP